MLAQSCVKDTYDFDKLVDPVWNPSLCSHVIHTTMSMKDFYGSDSSTVFLEDKDRFITLIYKNQLYSKAARDLIKISDQTFTEHFTDFTVDFKQKDSSTTIYPKDYGFIIPNGAEIDSMTFDSIFLKIHYTGTIPYKGKVNAISSSITKNGKPLDMHFMYNPSSTKDTSFYLKGYTFKFDNSGFIKNKLHFVFNATAYKNSGSVTDPNKYEFDASLEFKDIRFKNMFGYLGQQTFNVLLNDLEILIYNNLTSGSYHFIDPKLFLFSRNSTGIPISVNINKAIFKNKNDSLQLNSILLQQPWNMKYPTKQGNIAYDTLKFTTSNSNIASAINMTPNVISTNVNAITNPNGKGDQNFILSTSRIDIDQQIELPLWGTAFQYTLSDTLDFDYKKEVSENTKDIDYFNFLINLNNGFPVEGTIQIYLTDSLMHSPAIDSIFPNANQLIKPAIPGGSPYYKATQPVATFNKISIPQIRLKNWDKVKKIIVKVVFYTYKSGSQQVKIYGDNTLGIDIGFQTQFKVETKK